MALQHSAEVDVLPVERSGSGQESGTDKLWQESALLMADMHTGFVYAARDAGHELIEGGLLSIAIGAGLYAVIRNTEWASLAAKSVVPEAALGEVELYPRLALETTKGIGADSSAGLLEIPPSIHIPANQIGNLMTADTAKKFADMVHVTAQGWKKLSPLAESDHWSEFLAESGSRFEDISTAVSRFTAENNLPSLSVSLLSPRPWGNPGGIYADGRLAMRPNYLYRPDGPARIAEMGAHELTHLEQHYLVTSNFADQLGVGETATADQMAVLTAKLREVKSPATPGTIAEFLKTRAGRHLTPEAAERVNRLTQSHLDLFSSVGPKELYGREQNLNSMLSRLRSPSASEKSSLWQDLKTADVGRNLIAGIYGNEQSLNKYSSLLEKLNLPDSSQTWTADSQRHAKWILSKELKQAGQAIAAEKEAYYIRYRNSLHESEAYANGKIARDHFHTLLE